jgi:sigma-B regulation protein RsbU (phosphoserine phosphatase)
VVDADGPVLGDQEPGAVFHTVHHPFATGDLLVLFTDGIIEAPDKRGRMFGLRRLADTVRGEATRELPEVLAAIKNAFAAHVGDGEVDDDVTVVLVRQLPESRAG